MKSRSKKIIIGSIAIILTLMAPWMVLAQGAGGTSTKPIPPRGIIKVPVPVSSSPQPAAPSGLPAGALAEEGGGISGWNNAQAPFDAAQDKPPMRADGFIASENIGGLTISNIDPNIWEQGGTAFTRMLGTIVVPLRSVWALVHLLFSGWENNEEDSESRN